MTTSRMGRLEPTALETAAGEGEGLGEGDAARGRK